jgi:ABC-type phosphate transport system substrate-binding protein
MVLGLVISCSHPATETKLPEKVKVTGAGATFPYPLYKNWIESYHKDHKDVNIFYEPVGSGEGVRRFLIQEVVFGASGTTYALTGGEPGGSPPFTIWGKSYGRADFRVAF